MKPKVGKAVPMLSVPDMDAALVFWCDKLGFKVEGTYDDDSGKPCWAYLSQEGTKVMLTLEIEEEEARGSVLYFYPDDLRALHTSLVQAEVAVSEIETAFYGVDEFECIAPGGHPLWFGQESAEDNDNEN